MDVMRQYIHLVLQNKNSWSYSIHFFLQIKNSKERRRSFYWNASAPKSSHMFAYFSKPIKLLLFFSEEQPFIERIDKQSQPATHTHTRTHCSG